MKMKYFDITTVTTVRANNKSDAIALAEGTASRNTQGEVLSFETWTDRISAAEAQESVRLLTA